MWNRELIRAKFILIIIIQKNWSFKSSDLLTNSENYYFNWIILLWKLNEYSLVKNKTLLIDLFWSDRAWARIFQKDAFII